MWAGPVVEGRQGSPDGAHAVSTQGHGRCPRAVAVHAADDISPGISHERVAVVLNPRFRVGSALADTRDVAQVLDGPGSQENVPVRLTRGSCEGRRAEEEIGSRIRAVQLREAKIVAD